MIRRESSGQSLSFEEEEAEEEEGEVKGEVEEEGAGRGWIGGELRRSLFKTIWASVVSNWEGEEKR